MTRKFILIGSLLVFSSCALNQRGLKQANLSPINLALTGMLETSEDELAVAIVPFVETSFSAEDFNAAGGDIDRWKIGIQNQLYVRTERDLLKKFSKYPHFKIIDQIFVEEKVEELHFSMSVSSEATNLGNALGATHLLTAQVVRSPHPNSPSSDDIKDTYLYRLIDVESAQVLATQNEKN